MERLAIMLDNSDPDYPEIEVYKSAYGEFAHYSSVEALERRVKWLEDYLGVIAKHFNIASPTDNIPLIPPTTVTIDHS